MSVCIKSGPVVLMTHFLIFLFKYYTDMSGGDDLQHLLYGIYVKKELKCRQDWWLKNDSCSGILYQTCYDSWNNNRTLLFVRCILHLAKLKSAGSSLSLPFSRNTCVCHIVYYRSIIGPVDDHVYYLFSIKLLGQMTEKKYIEFRCPR